MWITILAGYGMRDQYKAYSWLVAKLNQVLKENLPEDSKVERGRFTWSDEYTFSRPPRPSKPITPEERAAWKIYRESLK